VKNDIRGHNGAVRVPSRSTPPLWPPVWLRPALDEQSVDAPPLGGPREADPETNSPPEVGKPEAPAWPPRDPRLATWPDRWRERWGRRSNALEDEGLTWRDAERRAFDETLAERKAAGLDDHDTPDRRD